MITKKNMKVKCLRNIGALFSEGEICDAKLIKQGIGIYKIESKKGHTFVSLTELETSKDFKIMKGE